MRRGILGIMVVWLAWTGSGAQTVVLHGLTNVTIGSTIYGSNYYGKNIFYNLTNANDGVSIHLGEADSGVFVYPVTDGDPPPGSFMAGEVYGSVNGEMDRLICKMRCHEEQDGIHPVQIDFSPLGATQFTYHAFYHGRLVARSRPQPGSMVAFGDWFSPLYPRVNPFCRTPDGSVGALIEFLNLETFTQYDPAAVNIWIPDAEGILADRLFIQAEGATNVVDFTSRLDITGGGGLLWFSIYEARLGVFRRAHKALPETLLQARQGSLTLSQSSSNATPGVAIELQPAIGFDVTFVPIEFGTNTALVITGIAVTSNGPGDVLGEARIARVAEAVEMSAHFEMTRPTNTYVVVYQDGVEVGRARGTNATVPATTRLAASGLQGRFGPTVPEMKFRFEQSAPVILPDQTSVAGDEVHFMAEDADGSFAIPETMMISAAGLESFTISAEAEQPLAQPRLTIRRVGRQYEISWNDPYRAFRLEGTRTLNQAFQVIELRPSYTGDVASILVGGGASEGAAFYRVAADLIPIN
jgi:hypothetical protein